MTTPNDPFPPTRDPFLVGANILLVGAIVAGLVWAAIQYPMWSAMIVGGLATLILAPYLVGKAWYAVVDRVGYGDAPTPDDDQRERVTSPSLALADLPAPDELDRVDAATRAVTESAPSGRDTSTDEPPSPYLDDDAWTPPHERDDEVDDGE